MKISPRIFFWLAGAVLVACLTMRHGPSGREPSRVAKSTKRFVRGATESRAAVAAQARTNTPSSFPVAELRAKLARWHQLTTGDTDAQERLTAELTAMLTDDNAAEIARALSADELETPFGLAALARWLAVDPAAAAWIAARADATETQALLVARALEKEPARLLEFCDALPDSDWKQSLLNAAALECGAQNPASVIGLAGRMAPGAAQTNALQTIAYDWMTRDPHAASAWIMQLADTTLRESLLVAGAKALASTDPDLATDWLTALTAGDARHETTLSLVETWGARDPVAAANWVARISSAESRAAAVELIARQWLRSDPSAANAWLAQQPEHDAVLAKLAAEYAGSVDSAELD